VRGLVPKTSLPVCTRRHSGWESTQQRVISSSNDTLPCCHSSEDSYCGLLGNNYHFYPEDGCSTGLRNVGNYLSHYHFHPKDGGRIILRNTGNDVSHCHFYHGDRGRAFVRNFCNHLLNYLHLDDGGSIVVQTSVTTYQTIIYTLMTEVVLSSE
jgi:hypothetical protein